MSVPDPVLSVVVPTHDNLPLLQRCLDAWERHAGGHAVEVIVVEDGCRDGTAAWLAERARTPWGRRHLRVAHEDNAHELVSTNRGLAEARGELVVSWHDDMFLRCGWLVPELVRTFAAYPELGMLALSRGLRFPPRDDLPETFAAVTEWSRVESTIGPMPGNWTHLHEVDGVVRPWVVRRSAVEAVGPLDPAFRPTEWDESDLAQRLHAAGHAVATHGYERDGAYVHAGSSTLVRTADAAYRERMVHNARLFFTRWGASLRARAHEPRRRWRRVAPPSAWAGTARGVLATAAARIRR